MSSGIARNWTVGLYTPFYWIGVLTIMACIAVACAGNTELLYRSEHAGFPLSWTLAGISILAFLAAEFCHPADTVKNETEDEVSQLVPEWEALQS